jgi:hypothetical protein
MQHDGVLQGIVNTVCVSYFPQYDTQCALCLSESTQPMIKQLINNRYAWERDDLYPPTHRNINMGERIKLYYSEIRKILN